MYNEADAKNVFYLQNFEPVVNDKWIKENNV